MKILDIKQKIKMIRLKDEYMTQIKASFGVGAKRSDQARRLVDGNIDLEKDKGAIQALAMVVNLQLVLDNLELKELET